MRINNVSIQKIRAKDALSQKIRAKDVTFVGMSPQYSVAESTSTISVSSEYNVVERIVGTSFLTQAFLTGVMFKEHIAPSTLSGFVHVDSGYTTEKVVVKTSYLGYIPLLYSATPKKVLSRTITKPLYIGSLYATTIVV